MIEIKCGVTETARDFQYWAAASGLSDSTRTRVASADIAVVPWERFRDHPQPLFPVGTSALFQYLKKSLPAGSEVELAVEDQDYREISLHSEIVRIATIVVRDGALSVLLNLLATWIARQIWPEAPTTSIPEVQASIIVVQTEGARTKSVQLSYNGPATTFETTVQMAFENTRISNPAESKDSIRPDAVDSQNVP